MFDYVLIKINKINKDEEEEEKNAQLQKKKIIKIHSHFVHIQPYSSHISLLLSLDDELFLLLLFDDDFLIKLDD